MLADRIGEQLAIDERMRITKTSRSTLMDIISLIGARMEIYGMMKVAYKIAWIQSLSTKAEVITNQGFAEFQQSFWPI